MITFETDVEPPPTPVFGFVVEPGSMTVTLMATETGAPWLSKTRLPVESTRVKRRVQGPAVPPARKNCVVEVPAPAFVQLAVLADVGSRE